MQRKENGGGRREGEAHIYSSVDCRGSALLMQRWASVIKLNLLDLSLGFHYILTKMNMKEMNDDENEYAF